MDVVVVECVEFVFFLCFEEEYCFWFGEWVGVVVEFNFIDEYWEGFIFWVELELYLSYVVFGGVWVWYFFFNRDFDFDEVVFFLYFIMGMCFLFF